ncbi:MAG: hypothetical protein IID46_12340 [Planctomycetes bacterium]|nr:hypothetical protein [Planctomycetota bacterium]
MRESEHQDSATGHSPVLLTPAKTRSITIATLYHPQTVYRDFMIGKYRPFASTIVVRRLMIAGSRISSESSLK